MVLQIAMTQLPPAFLYIGGSYPQLAAIQSLRRLGLYLVVTDLNADAPARDVADHFAQVSAQDIAAISALGDDVSKTHTIMGVYGVADYAFEAVLAVARRFELKGPRCEGARLLTDKAETSARLRAAKLPVPHLYWSGEAGPDARTLNTLTGRDLIVKPRSLNNSHAVIPLYAASTAALAYAIRTVAAADGGVMIEERVEGRIGNVDALMLAGSCHPISTTIRRNDPITPAVCTAMIQPGGTPDCEQGLFVIAEQVANALGYDNGPLTVDIVHGADGKISILEVSPHFHNINCEIARHNGNPMAAYGAWLMESADWRRYLPNGKSCYGVLFQKFVDGDGVIKAIHGMDELSRWPCHVDTRIVSKVGDHVTHTTGRKNLLCLVWAVSDRRKDIDDVVRFIENDVRADVEASV
jgi:phosphoribosylaminoimidazole carboxylase (NCAIR synthetase)